MLWRKLLPVSRADLPPGMLLHCVSSLSVLEPVQRSVKSTERSWWASEDATAESSAYGIFGRT